MHPSAPAAGHLSRRGFLKHLAGTAAAALSGCAASKFRLSKCEIAPDTPFSDLVAHLNQNIDQINSWRCLNVGLKTPLGLARGLNELWSKGGLQYAPPIR